MDHMDDREVRRGAGIYSRAVLGVYDLLVIRLSNSFAWRCPSRLMLDRYNRLLGRRHLDAGPGTGWYLGKAGLPAGAEITLLDLNPNSLDSAASRLEGVPCRRLLANALDALPEGLGPFDSVGANYLMHCIPGSWQEKGVVFRRLAERLEDDGVLFGSTILGRGVRHNLAGRRLMSLYNRLGVFHNRDDDAAGLERALARAFHEHSVEIVGTVAMFTARRPRREGESEGAERA